MASPRLTVYIRRAVQALSLSLLLLIVSMTRDPLAWYVRPEWYFLADPLVLLSTSLAERMLLPGLGVSLAVLLIAALLGRVFCGWFCPLGAVIDIAGHMRSRALKALGRKAAKERGAGPARFGKHFLLAAIALLALLGVQAAWMLDPITIIVRALSFTIYPSINNGIEGLFAFSLERTGFSPPLESLYFFCRNTFLSVSARVFPHAAAIGVLFWTLIGASFITRRFWCRYLCPLGAFLALASRFSLLRRRGTACSGTCSLCKDTCRMGAIRSDNSYDHRECVLCMDCAAVCPSGRSTFTFSKQPKEPAAASDGPAAKVTRRQFLFSLAGSLAALSGCRGKLTAPLQRVLRPPAALPEGEFVDRCIRCGNCMKVCITNVLQPALWESGLACMWTPKLDTSIGYCEHQCTLCGKVCPTGALAKLSVEQKIHTKIGCARVDQEVCLPWARGEECLVCEEHCPVSSKAIKMTAFINASGEIVKVPSVDPSLCVGCAICEFKCPVEGKRKGIVVEPL